MPVVSFFVIGLGALLLAARPAAGGPAPAIPSEIWPAPVSMTTGSSAVPLCGGFMLACEYGSACPDPLPAALSRYTNLIFFAGPPITPDGDNPDSFLCSLLVRVGSDAPLSAGVDESYTLTVPDDGSAAVLTAATQWGALRGLESFLQLVVWQGPDAAPGTYLVTNAPVAVADAPRFAHRGVLIDTSFNFLTVQAIFDTLDSMAVMKANVLHWHALDDPAWPLVSTAFPAFTAPGGAGPYAQVATYSVADQAAIAAYAWARGVMILLEFDLPGHSASWAAGGADLVVACDGHQTLINPVGEPGQAGTIYGVLAALVTELFGRIGSPGLPWVHLGGDEVTDYTCWLQSPAVQAWAAALGLNGSDSRAVRGAFTERVQTVAAGAGLRPLFWEETFTGGFGVRNGSIVTPWVHPWAAGAAAAAGHDVLNYAGYYLDQWVPPAQTDPDWYAANVSYGFIDSWRLLYAYDAEAGVSAGAPGHVLGGVACAWGDNVDSAAGAVGLLYPRGLAVGEKLWSPRNATAVADVQVDGDALDAVAARMEHARCRLVQRGLAAAPVGIAGTYGFCWRPSWGGATSAAPADATVSSGALAGAVLAATVAGAALAVLLLPASRSALVAWVAKAVLRGPGGGGALSSQCDPEAVVTRPAPTVTVTAPPSSVATAASSASSAGGGGGGGGERVVALDQFRGMTMVAMLFVNLYYGRSGLWPILSHGITYCSGPDLVEPAFHFAVGFALRLVVLKRLAALARGSGGAAAPGWWAARWAVFRPLLKNRVAGLIILSMFFTEGWGSFDSWAALGGFSDWATQLVQNRQPYHTLLHIAFITVWTFLAMSVGWRWRAAQLAGTAALHAAIHRAFYFRWIAVYTLDEGGWFGFTGWAIEALAGSLCHDVVMHYRQQAAAAAAKAAAGEVEEDGGDGGGANSSGGAGASAPLLTSDHLLEVAPTSAAAASALKPPVVSSANALNRGGGGSNSSAAAGGGGGVGGGQHPGATARAAAAIAGGAVAGAVLAYLLSCLGRAGPAFNPVCYDGTRVFFWGGFGAEADCAGVPAGAAGSAWLVAPPFALPDPGSNVVSMWTMTQRAGSVTYHLFTAATSALFLSLLLLACEAGLPAPAWWPAVARPAAAVLGIHATATGAGGSRLLLRWHVAEVMGENALAVYLLGDSLGNNVGNMLPADCPNWYFLLWGEGLYLAVAYVAAAYLRAHKLFLRL